MDKNKGWVKLWREQFSHEISERKPWCDSFAWSYLYARANYKTGIVNFRNQYIGVERGQFITSFVKLSVVFGWSRRRTLAFIESLSKRQMCTYRTTNRFVTITICNYEKYQGTDEENDTTDVATGDTTDAQQVHTNKKVLRKNKNIGRSSKKTDADPRVKEFLNFWGETFKRETGQPYLFSFDRDGRLTKDLLKLYTLDVLQEATRVYFRDEWCRGKGFDFGLFKSQVGRLISLKAINPLEQARRERERNTRDD